jgi:hypothetical protein
LITLDFLKGGFNSSGSGLILAPKGVEISFSVIVDMQVA